MGEVGQQTQDVSADANANTDVEHRPKETRPRHAGSFGTQPSTCWTDVIPKTAHNKLFLECDFGPTTLGPIADWGPALRLYTSMLFADSRGGGIYWGPDRVAIYNEKLSVVCGKAHPFLMGNPLQVAFPTISDQISPVFDEVTATGQTVDVENISLFLIRNGFLEETYFIGQFIPLRGDSGEIEGFYNTVYESTARVLRERRRLVVDHIAAIPPLPVDETLKRIVEALRGNPNDIPMALLYYFDEVSSDGSSNLRLRGSIGVPDAHCCAPAEAILETCEEGLIPIFRQVKAAGKLFVLSEADGSIETYRDMFAGVDWRGYGEPSRTIVIVPLSITGPITGFYVQGTNPRGVYDEATEMSIIDATRQIEAKWISSISREQAKVRERVLEQRAVDSEGRLRHMAMNAPLGMCQIGPDHRLQWANDQYYEITGHDRHDPDMAAFRRNLPLEEQDSALESLYDLLNGRERTTREVRLNRKWRPPVEEVENGEESSAWMLTTSFPLMENGKVKLIMGYVTDISHQKWAESVQKHNAGAALLAKQRQEAFIDTTSHEMRNPLNAITQLANSIAQSLDDEDQIDTPDSYRKIVEENVDAASTILACAAHQKRVIDDVLILSRLESHMLSIHPIVDQPSKLVKSTVKMFEGEVATSGMTIEAVEHESSDNLRVQYVLMDPSRLAQILINLISNAIKFTASQQTRELSVLYGVQKNRPPLIKSAYGDIAWVKSEHDDGNVALPPLREDEERLYLYFCVNDTGSGVSTEEMAKLFKRFSQATPKTHVEFGGSGLGLYICKELAEKQGGGVGVASIAGEGSGFGFYVETRAAKSPVQDAEQQDTSSVPRSKRMSDERSPLQSIPADPAPTETKPLQEHTISVSEPLAIPRREKTDDRHSSYHALLVEDNLINQKVLAKQLRKAGWTISVANNGAEALEVLNDSDCWRKNDPASKDESTKGSTALSIQVVLMDLEMPVMNGLDCCRRIRELEHDAQITRRLPVIAMTANVRQEQKEQAFAAGMDGVVSKPFTVDELVGRVKEVVDEVDSG